MVGFKWRVPAGDWSGSPCVGNRWGVSRVASLGVSRVAYFPCVLFFGSTGERGPGFTAKYRRCGRFG
eukprot:scaffold37695_cov58-Attheya_sp.AAC.2